MRSDAQIMRLRVSPTLKAWLREQAKRNCRSMNAEITFRLEVARLGLQPARDEAAAGQASRA